MTKASSQIQQDAERYSYGAVIAPDTVQFERLLPGSVEEIWPYIVEGEKRALWLADGDMTRVGESVPLEFNNNELSGDAEIPPPEFADKAECFQMPVEILELDRPRLLRITWGKCSEVTFELSAQGAETLLTLTHRKLDRDSMLMVGPGWHNHLDILAAKLSNQKPKKFWETFMALRKDYTARLAK